MESPAPEPIYYGLIFHLKTGAVSTSRYRYGEGFVHFSHFGCIGHEDNITSCRHTSAVPSYCSSHSSDAGVVCRGICLNMAMFYVSFWWLFPSEPCADGDVQLVGDNRYHSFGWVEVCIDGIWGKVCNDQWTNQDASVLCRQLGFSSYGSLATELC